MRDEYLKEIMERTVALLKYYYLLSFFSYFIYLFVIYYVLDIFIIYFHFYFVHLLS